MRWLLVALAKLGWALASMALWFALLTHIVYCVGRIVAIETWPGRYGFGLGAACMGWLLYVGTRACARRFWGKWA